MRSTYQRANSYTFKCCPPLCKDILHTAYVRHFDKHGTNLFDRDIYVVLRWVKNVWFNEIRSNRYQKNGELYNRQFIPTSEEWSEDTVTLKSTSLPPDSEIITKEFYQDLFRRIDNYTSGHPLGYGLDPKLLRLVVERLDEGYTYPEICKELGMSSQRVYYYKKKLQGIIKDMELSNPFHGSRVKISKKITRKHYEQNPDKYGDFIYDPDRDCDCNEAYTITINSQGEYLLIREKGD